MSSEICHRKSKAPGVFSADRSKAVPLLQFCFCLHVGNCTCAVVSSHGLFLIVLSLPREGCAL